MADRTDNTDIQKNDRTGKFLFGIYFVCLVLSIVLIFRLLYIQFIFRPAPILEEKLTPQSIRETIEPVRGSILSYDGKLLASTIPTYQIYMDCTVLKDEHENDKDREKGRKDEEEWLGKARLLSEKLAEAYGDKTADEYYNTIISGRRNGKKYVRIGYEIDHRKFREIQTFPLFDEGRYKGGIITVRYDKRKYPYESLARRVLGYIDDDRTEGRSRIGIEGSFNYALKGEEGVEWMKLTDKRKRIPDFDSTSVMAENGLDIRTTVDIVIQDIADRALRKNMAGKEIIEGGCAVVMDVKTGAIRAMVNLRSDGNGNFGETFNYAIGRAGDPGSVFKLTTLMTLLEDGKVTLDTEVPTFRGFWEWKGEKLPRDPYLQNRGEYISVADGLKISSNHVFRYLACENYGGSPESEKRFIGKLYEYKLNEKFDFDLAGLAQPVIPMPGSYRWSGTALPSIAIGYSVLETPLHVLMFYNAIANKGKMMKPYIVECTEKDGKTVTEYGPEILNGAICSTETADTLIKALSLVVEEGTGKALRDARCKVAGKTGTAQIPFPAEINGKLITVYKDNNGNRKHQGTFVGFFPADDPQYSAIVTIYSKLSRKDLYGGTLPAATFREIVDEVYALSPTWGRELAADGDIPEMTGRNVVSGADNLEEIPDVMGLGLTDAIWSIENCGYSCSYTGTGHVASQTPAAGTHKARGETVRISLK